MPARASTDETAARAIIVALHRSWNAIRARHGEVPPVVLAIGTPSPRRVTRLVRLGHFARWRWFAAGHSDPDPLRLARASLRDAIDNDDLSAALGAHADILLLTAVQLSREARTSVSEVLVTCEGLDRGAHDVLATLLHEASHAIADERGIKDTSRQGRYHNQRFKNIAEELGLEVRRDPEVGWSLTNISEATANAYSASLAELAAALRADPSSSWPSTAPRRVNAAHLVCGCGRRTRDGRRGRFPAAAICSVCGCGDLER